MRFVDWLQKLFTLCLILILLTQSVPTLSTPEEKARRFTRPIEFDYVTWELNALGIKIGQAGIDPNQLFSLDAQKKLVYRYFELTEALEVVQLQVEQIYADPSISDPAVFAKSELAYQEDLQSSLEELIPLIESVLQEQVSEILVDMDIAGLGDEIPPLLFHTTPLPKALIVSPRSEIQQEVNISLLADLTLEQITHLENQVEDYSGSSALVVDVGGIGVYPTMVMRTSNLPWVVDTIAHEWTHNYLTLRPLGLNYDTTPELRTMNETTASIAGGEISQAVLERFYADFLADTPDDGEKLVSLTLPSNTFDFRAEMHKTRVRVDELLADGKIEEAEKYMELQREVFVSHGYVIRKINQAYFAFYGAYADQPGGAAGEDPVGPAVREFRAQCSSLSDFLQKISQMNSYEDLKAAINQN